MWAVSLSLGIGVSLLLGLRVHRLRKDNRSMHTRFVEIDQMKRNFISHVSHELKAPLASMQETTHLLLEQIPGPLTDKQRRLLDLNLQSGKRLAEMIGNILDLSRLEAGLVEYDMPPPDISELMASAGMGLSPPARENTP